MDGGHPWPLFGVKRWVPGETLLGRPEKIQNRRAITFHADFFYFFYFLNDDLSLQEHSRHIHQTQPEARERENVIFKFVLLAARPSDVDFTIKRLCLVC